MLNTLGSSLKNSSLGLSGWIGRHKKLSLLVLLAVVLSVAAWLLLSDSFGDKQGNQDDYKQSQITELKSVCDKQIIKEASNFIVENSISELSGVVDSIKAKQDYKLDPNCVYIVLRGSIMLGNVSASEAHQQQLRDLYLSGLQIRYSDAFVAQPLSLEETASFIEIMKQNQANQQQQQEQQARDLQLMDEKAKQ